MVSPSSRAPPPSISGASGLPSSRLGQHSTVAPPSQPAFGTRGDERARTTSGSSVASSKDERGHRRGTTSAPAQPASKPTSRTVSASSSSSAALPPSSSAASASGAPSLYDLTRANFDHFLSCASASTLATAVTSLSSLHSYPAASLSKQGGLADEPEPPKVFLTSWVDYTHKYGTAYSLTDGTAGVYFNDSTSMVLSPAKQWVLFRSLTLSPPIDLLAVKTGIDRSSFLARTDTSTISPLAAPPRLSTSARTTP